MKVSRYLYAMILLAACAVASAQSANPPAAPVSAAQKSFTLLKTLAGNWQGAVTTDSPAWSTDKPLPLTIRVGSQGNALIHELNTGGPEVTMLYVEKDRLALLHYCDFGNRVRMAARDAAEANVVEFELTELSGIDPIGHVTRGVFTVVDANRHIEDWTFTPPTGKPVHAHMDFKRVP